MRRVIVIAILLMLAIAGIVWYSLVAAMQRVPWGWHLAVMVVIMVVFTFVILGIEGRHE